MLPNFNTGFQVFDPDEIERQRKAALAAAQAFQDAGVDPRMATPDTAAVPAANAFKHVLDIQNGPFGSRVEYGGTPAAPKAVALYDRETGMGPALGGVPSVAQANEAEFGALQARLAQQQQAAANQSETGYADVPTMRKLASMIQPNQSGYAGNVDWGQVMAAQQGLIGRRRDADFAQQHLDNERAKIDAIAGQNDMTSDRALEGRRLIEIAKRRGELLKTDPTMSPTLAQEIASKEVDAEIADIRTMRDQRRGRPSAPAVHPGGGELVGPPAPKKAAPKTYYDLFGADVAKMLEPKGDRSAKPGDVVKAVYLKALQNQQGWMDAEREDALVRGLVGLGGEKPVLDYANATRRVFGTPTDADNAQAAFADLIARRNGVTRVPTGPQSPVYTWENFSTPFKTAGSSVWDFLLKGIAQAGKARDRF